MNDEPNHTGVGRITFRARVGAKESEWGIISDLLETSGPNPERYVITDELQRYFGPGRMKVAQVFRLQDLPEDARKKVLERAAE